MIGDDDTHSVFAWLRTDPSGEAPAVLVVVNATPTVHYGYRIGVPLAGEWAEIINTDSDLYGGSGLGNLGLVRSDGQAWHGHDQSLVLALPPLAVLYLPRLRVARRGRHARRRAPVGSWSGCGVTVAPTS